MQNYTYVRNDILEVVEGGFNSYLSGGKRVVFAPDVHYTYDNSKYIYLLLSPQERTVVYVGQTYNPYTRSSRREKSSIHKLDLFMLVADKCHNSQTSLVTKIERSYINFFRDFNLKNRLLPLLNSEEQSIRGCDGYSVNVGHLIMRLYSSIGNRGDNRQTIDAILEQFYSERENLLSEHRERLLESRRKQSLIDREKKEKDKKDLAMCAMNFLNRGGCIEDILSAYRGHPHESWLRTVLGI
jgi:hypothetical protein